MIWSNVKRFHEIFLKIQLNLTVQCGKTRNSLSQKRKKNRQINSLVTYLVKPLLSRNFCQKCVRETSRNFHNVLWQCHSVEKWGILSHRKNISWNQLFSNLFSKTVAFTKFLSKKCERNLKISTLWVWKKRTFMLNLFSQKFRESNNFY